MVREKDEGIFASTLDPTQEPQGQIHGEDVGGGGGAPSSWDKAFFDSACSLLKFVYLTRVSSAVS